MPITAGPIDTAPRGSDGLEGEAVKPDQRRIRATSRSRATSGPRAPTDPRATSAEFRPDLEGLRGVAILLVLLFHAGVPGFDGGFVGVDVFFVLSGFLITGLLLRERERSGRIDLGAFYARRARRILPAAAVVLAATMILSWFLLAPLDLPRVSADAVAAALSVGNIRFAAGATDYFGTDLTPSPVLHYWSLGVEEQFYLLWPALLILATRSRRPRAAAGLLLLGVAIVSYLAAFLLTDAAPAWAFYSLPTRAWQLALGGLLAVGAVRLGGVPDRVAVPLGWLGLGAILATLAVIVPGTPYPGLAALLPAFGSAAVIMAGVRPRSVASLLATSGLRFLGRISYSLYLVHWPILVLPAAGLAVGETLPFEVRIGLAAVSVAVGWASYRWVEQPVHRGPRFAWRPSRTLAAAGVALTLTVAVCGSVGLAASAELDQGWTTVADAGSMAPADASAATPTAATAPTAAAVFAAATAGPASEASPSPTPTPTPRGPEPLPANVHPSLRAAGTDAETLEADGCLLGQPQTKPPKCVYGDKHGTYTVALVGDSHAAHWFPAILAIAKDRGWRLVPFIKLSCRFLDMPLYSHWYQRMYTECDTWRDNVVARLKALKPDLVIEASIRDLVTTNATDKDPVHQGEAMARLLEEVPGAKAIIVDTPISRYNVPTCLSSHRSDVRPCETSRSFALGASPGVVERTAAAALGASLIDVTPIMCPGDSPCPVVIDGMIVYRDNQHMTATFATSLRGYLEAGLPPEPPPPSPRSPST
jgi:peptidoglycan/LPS O-acetylase OafA/YrhL